MFILQRLFMMLLILFTYSVKSLPPARAAFEEVGKEISTPISTEKTPEGIEPLFPGLKLTAYHLQAITLPIAGKHELRVRCLVWLFLTFIVLKAATGELGHAMSRRERSPHPLMAPLPFPPYPGKV